VKYTEPQVGIEPTTARKHKLSRCCPQRRIAGEVFPLGVQSAAEKGPNTAPKTQRNGNASTAHPERSQNAAIGKIDGVGGVAREFATPSATSAVRGKRGGQGARFDDACQLCSVHGLARSQVRMAQPAVAWMAGLRICAQLFAEVANA
jgi:hypothetical protein